MKDCYPGVSRGVAIMIVGTAVIVIAGVFATPVGIYLPILLLTIAFVAWSYPRPVVAITTIILMNAYVLEQSAGISPLEIGVGIYLYGYLGFWFFRRFFIQRRAFLTHPADLAMTGFLLVCAVSVCLLIAAEARIDYWFRELLTLSTFLLYFPAREAMRSRRGMLVVFSAMIALIVTLALLNIFKYRASTLATNYLWELWGGRQAFGTAFYVFLTVAGVSLHAHVEGFARRTGTLLLTVIGAVALGTTFYRGFWIGALLGCATLLILVNRRQRIRILVTGATGGMLAALLLFAVAGNLASFIFEALVVRLASSGNALADVSIANRIAESQTVLRLIADSPLVGHGLGVWFHHLNIITRTTEVVMYVHNVYLYLLLEVGAVGFVLFGLYYFLIIRAGVRLSREAHLDPFRLAMIRCAVGMSVAFLFIATNSGILQDKQAILVMILGSAVVTSDPVM